MDRIMVFYLCSAVIAISLIFTPLLPKILGIVALLVGVASVKFRYKEMKKWQPQNQSPSSM